MQIESLVLTEGIQRTQLCGIENSRLVRDSENKRSNDELYSQPSLTNWQSWELNL